MPQNDDSTKLSGNIKEKSLRNLGENQTDKKVQQLNGQENQHVPFNKKQNCEEESSK